MKDDFKVIVTIGPSSENAQRIKRMSELGPCIFRINGAYVPVNKIKYYCDLIHSAAPDNKILLDFPSDKEWFKKRDKRINTTFLVKKDISLIKKACHLNIDYLGMSHVRDINDIAKVKTIIKDYGMGFPALISKIETVESVVNLNQILHEVNHILIDRGDLSREIGMNELPRQQEYILEEARLHKIPAYLATNFLKTMQSEFTPTIAEACDLYKTIASGVAGIQLSEETAIGMFPVRCVEYVFNLYKIYKRSQGVSWKPGQNNNS